MANGEPTTWDLQRQLDRNDRDARDRDTDRRTEIRDLESRMDRTEKERRDSDRWKIANILIPTLGILVSIAAVLVAILR
jgi:hypothetical protein